MATKKTSAKRSAVAKRRNIGATEEALSVGEILEKFRREADKHMDVVKRIRTRIAPNKSIITARGDTDK